MRFIITGLFILLMASNVDGQIININPYSGSSSPYSSFNSTSHQTPYSIQVPSDFLFLVDDDIQKITFNPAYASKAERSFIKGIFDRGPNNNFFISGFTPSNSGGWFFTLGGAISKDESSDNFNDFHRDYETQVNSYNNSRQEEFEERTAHEFRFNERDNYQAEFRLIKVFEPRGNLRSALGVFGGFSENLNRGGQNYRSEEFYRRQIFRMDTLFSQREQNSLTRNDSKTNQSSNRFIFGLEYYSTKKNSDTRHRIYFQKNDLERTKTLFYTREIINEIFEVSTNDEETQTSGNVREVNSVSSTAPIQFSYDLYKNKRLNVFGEDFLVANFQFTYGFGEQVLRSRYWESYGSSANGITQNKENIDGSVSFENPKTNLVGGRFSTGYVITYSGGDFNVFTGLSPYVELSFEDIKDISTLDKIYRNNNVYRTGVMLPVFGSFDVSSTMTIWGGASAHFNHSYFDLDSQIEPFVATQSTDDSLPVLKNSSERKETSLSQSMYVGFRFEHPSGLGINVNTRGSISSIHNWMMSLRYSF